MDLFRKSAGYRFLDAFVLANVVELGTRHFCNRFLTLQNDPGGRTFSQMTHAARSGCRNFAEGSERLMTSYATALELLDVARASLCELRDDCNEWLMMQWQAPWPVESDQAQRIYTVRLDTPDYGTDINRGFCLHVMAQCRKFEPELFSDDSLVRANTLLILISRTLNMMDKYIKKVGEEFVAQGGFRERLSTVRSETRAKQGGPADEGPKCPKCGAATRLRRTREGNRPFWGCSEYPACRGIVDYHEPDTGENR
ncbi:MAG: topoisomerase DNA-binding C4 zinc finger domain-containing protein [Kiritimatiellae bacterium]|nr:topoisomerase DNA-binding C4 zinc finger domain-containing protein [Kiritimatiellia bacterium]